MSEALLTIGELARRAGVATSALRYYEELGLLAAPTRIAGQRRYPESAVELVGGILLLRDIGFSLAELKDLMASGAITIEDWRHLAKRKLADLDQQIARAQLAREALSHSLHCPSHDLLQCRSFARVVTARLAGRPLSEVLRPG